MQGVESSWSQHDGSLDHYPLLRGQKTSTRSKSGFGAPALLSSTSRSKTCGERQTPCWTGIQVIFALLKPLSSRWRSFRTREDSEIPSSWLASEFKGVSASNLPELILLSWEHGVHCDSEGFESVVLFDEPTPRLRNLSIPAVATHPNRMHLSPNLLHIEVERNTFSEYPSQGASEIPSILSALPNLELRGIMITIYIVWKHPPSTS